MQCWADLQSVHGFRCYDNIAPNAKCQRVLVLAYTPGLLLEYSVANPIHVDRYQCTLSHRIRRDRTERNFSQQKCDQWPWRFATPARSRKTQQKNALLQAIVRAPGACLLTNGLTDEVVQCAVSPKIPSPLSVSLSPSLCLTVSLSLSLP